MGHHKTVLVVHRLGLLGSGHRLEPGGVLQEVVQWRAGRMAEEGHGLILPLLVELHRMRRGRRHNLSKWEPWVLHSCHLGITNKLSIVPSL